MGFQVGDCSRNSLVGRPLVERSFRLLSTLPSVAMHVVGSEMAVVDANRLPLAVYERKKDDLVALDRPSRVAEAYDNPVDDADLDSSLVWHGRAASHAERTATPKANDPKRKALADVTRSLGHNPFRRARWGPGGSRLGRFTAERMPRPPRPNLRLHRFL